MQTPIEDARVRAKIREVLELAKGYGRTTDVLLEEVNFLLGCKPGTESVADEQLARCTEWNLAHGYVRMERDEDLDKDRWILTPAGKAKQNESLTK